MKEYDLYTPDGEMLGGFTDLTDLEDRAEELKLEDYRIVVSVHPDPPLQCYYCESPRAFVMARSVDDAIARLGRAIVLGSLSDTEIGDLNVMDKDKEGVILL